MVRRALLGVWAAAVVTGCGGDEFGSGGSSSDASAESSAGAAGSATAGTSASGASGSGTSGDGGASGNAGESGSAGKSGSGSSGESGASGSAGHSGSAGASGTAGRAGDGGQSGSGMAGASGGAGMGGAGGSAGGTGAVAGMGGAGGSGGLVGSPQCETADDCTLHYDCCLCAALHDGEKDPPTCNDVACFTDVCTQMGVMAPKCVHGQCTIEANCDLRGIACGAPTPLCPSGQVPSAAGLCYGPCVETDDCKGVVACSDCTVEQTCVSYQVDGPVPLPRCVDSPPVCNLSRTCACLGPALCVDPFNACTQAAGGEITCGCPAC